MRPPLPSPVPAALAAPLAVLLLLSLLAACTGGAGGEQGADGKDGTAPSGGTTHAARWQPEPGTDWHWQLTGTLDMDVDVPVYDIDGFRHDASVVRRLHARGVKVICYVNVGAWEDWRPDAARFPERVRGRGNGWEGERWLDIRALDTLRPLIASRFDMCRDKGFDAVEPDLQDGYRNRTGFPLTAGHQLAFNRMVASLAHERGLSVGLKNDLDQIPELVGDFDFAVNEECAAYGECERLTPFVRAGKAVLHVEYALPAAEFCDRSRELGLSSMAKRLHLDAWRDAC
ncbi:endo alpha-1,4 polygalactosaminidase [Streptomyces sp. 549]|uniref:endo alpha-1,4 polygalactosaminidase n=1 Tax=Streptomyces sp. 549 TaxID=3049076 RepID=UPI0024C38E88|nr:endo alpha-1,4 polygalactosaminidase [Streptomyces sp. 549]MDK1474973.1 endo alpha-1,4 polygalactosaminidase [Streptomyces sp. 549]